MPFQHPPEHPRLQITVRFPRETSAAQGQRSAENSKWQVDVKTGISDELRPTLRLSMSDRSSTRTSGVVGSGTH